MGECPSHLKLSRFKTFDLDDAESSRIAAHLETCEACRNLSLGMDENIARYNEVQKNGLDALLRAVDAEKTNNRSRLRPWLAVGSVTAAAAAALLLLLLGGFDPKERAIEDAISFKGAFAMEVTAKRGTEQFGVKTGTVLKEGDAVRFTVTVDRPGYLAVFSRESDGNISPFYPETEPSSDPSPLVLDSPGRHTLHGSIVLDDATGEERFIAVFSPHSFDRTEVLKKGGNLDPKRINALGEDFIVESITVMKGD